MPKFDLFDDTIVRNISYDQQKHDICNEHGMIVATAIAHTDFTAKGIKDNAIGMIDLQGREITVSGKKAIVTNISVSASATGFDEYTIEGKIYGNDDAVQSHTEALKASAEVLKKQFEEERAKFEAEKKRLAEEARRLEEERLRAEELERNRVKTRIIRLRKYREKKTGQE